MARMNDQEFAEMEARLDAEYAARCKDDEAEEDEDVEAECARYLSGCCG